MKKLIIIFCLFGKILLGQTYLTNTGNKPVTIALAWNVNSESFAGIICKGWITIDPGEKLKTEAIGEIYIHKKGNKYPNYITKFLVGIGNFTIRNANMQYVKDQNPNYQWAAFQSADPGGIESFTNSLNKKETVIDVK